MPTLADMAFESLEAGMKFRHAEHGEQVILDLGRGQVGPVIQFHNCPVYSGQVPQWDADQGEFSIFQLIAQNTFPYGAEGWEYLGMVEPQEVAACGWQWFQVNCPHCATVQRFLAPAPPEGARQCRACGMVFIRPAQPGM